MPREATSGARSSLGESRVPRDAAALVAAAARLRGALSDAEAARVGTAEILALLRAPRDADAPSPRRLRARCGWALDHGVVDALVEAMRAHADCVPLQTLAATCLADVAEAFVDEHEAVIKRDFSASDARDENETPHPFDSPSGVVTNADLCVDAFHALAMRRHERHHGGAVSDLDERIRSRFAPKFDPGSFAEFGETDDALVGLAEANTRHAPFFRDENSFATRRALVSRATTRVIPPHGTFRVETLNDDGDDAEKQNDRSAGDRTLVLRGDVVAAATRETSDETSDVDETTRFFSRAREGRNPNPNPKTTPLEAPLLSEEGPSFEDLCLFPERQARSRRFVAGDALDPGSNPGANRSGAARVFRAGAEGCVLVTAPVWPLEARAVADAVDEGLRGFFGAAEEEEEEEEEEEGFGAEREALRDVGQKKQTFIDGVEDEFHSARVEKSALLATLFEQKNQGGVSSRRFWCSPHARLARDGAADAVLHVALRCAGAGARLDTAYADEDDGTRSSRARLASACFSFLENLASPPCDVSVLKSLGADGAMDRVVATKAAFEARTSESDEDRETHRALAAADRALRALARCEQNMRAAFSLGAAEIVW
jgi:hypothetical protein